MYIVFNFKLAAWWSKSSIWTTDFSQVKPMPRDAAIAFCKSRFTDGSLTCAPVALADIEEVRAK